MQLSGDKESQRMVNVAIVMTTGAEQSALTLLPGTSATGVASVSFHESFEGRVVEGKSMTAGTSLDSAGAKSAVLRIGLIRLEGDATAGAEKMAADAREQGGEAQLSPGGGRETSKQEIAVAVSEKEDSTQDPSTVAVEDLP